MQISWIVLHLASSHQSYDCYLYGLGIKDIFKSMNLDKIKMHMVLSCTKRPYEEEKKEEVPSHNQTR